MAALLLCAASVASAAPPTARATFAEVAPRVDGRLTDAAWKQAKRYSGFVERKPVLRQRPPERTQFAIVFDAKALYVAVWCFDSKRRAIRARTRQRDSDAIFSDDALSVKIDAQHDHRTTLGFAINPASARLDYRGIDEEDFRIEFDALWTGRARRTRWGWSVEMRIPYSALGIDPGSPPKRIGLNFTRDHPRRNASYDWALLAPPFSPIAASRYGHLVGLDALPAILAKRSARASRLSYAVTPWMLVGHEGNPAEGIAGSGRGSAGVDAWLARGSRWRLQLTVNTDFAQADLDDQAVNLGQFGLFFPEKRDFFLRDFEVFSTSLAGVQMVYTRRIGLQRATASQSSAVPILAGLKLVARPLSSLRVGVLQVTTRPTGDQPWTSYLVARTRYELGGGSNVGVYATHRQSLEEAKDHNAVVGVDAAWRSQDTPLLIHAVAGISMTGAKAGTPEPGAAVGATRVEEDADKPRPGAVVQVRWRGLLLRPTLSYGVSDERVRSDLAYIDRVGVHVGTAELTTEPRIQRWGLERLTITLYARMVARVDGSELLDWSSGGIVTLRSNIGFVASVQVERNSETVLSPLGDSEREDLVYVNPGTYARWRGIYTLETPSVWPLSLSGTVETSDYYEGGKLLRVRAELTLRASALVRLAAAGEHTRIRFRRALPSKVLNDRHNRFNSELLGARLILGFTPRLGLTTTALWNSVSNLIRLQSRLRWIYRSNSDFFVVYQHDLDQHASTKLHTLIAKVTYRWQ
ncbi:MAG: carbohydrate binding family 9 domain-containing protein [Myxococcales bacterium]|nr:carbohydrate binding family 9 domain-containing protein [Myxococcales bacterium]